MYAYLQPPVITARLTSNLTFKNPSAFTGEFSHLLYCSLQWYSWWKQMISKDCVGVTRHDWQLATNENGKSLNKHYVLLYCRFILSNNIISFKMQILQINTLGMFLGYLGCIFLSTKLSVIWQSTEVQENIIIIIKKLLSYSVLPDFNVQSLRCADFQHLKLQTNKYSQITSKTTVVMQKQKGFRACVWYVPSGLL